MKNHDRVIKLMGNVHAVSRLHKVDATQPRQTQTSAMCECDVPITAYIIFSARPGNYNALNVR